MPKPIENLRGDNTFSFHPDKRSPHDVQIMQKIGYVEKDEYHKPGKIRSDGYFCGSCKAFQHKPHTIGGLVTSSDGWCQKYKFADRDYGCCGGWEPKQNNSTTIKKEQTNGTKNVGY